MQIASAINSAHPANTDQSLNQITIDQGGAWMKLLVETLSGSGLKVLGYLLCIQNPASASTTSSGTIVELGDVLVNYSQGCLKM